MDDLMDCDWDCLVYYCTLLPGEELAATMEAVESRASAAATGVAAGTPLRDVVNKVKEAVGFARGDKIFGLHLSTRSWIDVTDTDIQRGCKKGVLHFKVLKAAAVPSGIGGAPASGLLNAFVPGRKLDLLQSFWSACRGRTPGNVTGYIPVKEWKELNIHHNLNVPRRRGLYVRNCFKRFLRVCLEKMQRPDAPFIHVNGPPGIGKSAFLWYVVMMVGAATGNPEAEAGLNLDYDIIVQLALEDKTTGWVGFFRDGSVGYHGTSPDGLTSRLSGRVPLHLVDQKYQGDHVGYVMVFASPDEGNTKQIDKSGGAQVVQKVLPPWKADEFYELMQNELEVDKNAVQKIVEKWGYNPRMVFKTGAKDTDWSNLPTVIEKVALVQAPLLVGKKFQVEHSEIPCRLFEMVPDPATYETFTVQFASDYLAEAYLDRYWENRKDEVVTFVKSSAGQADIASLRGYAYEYAMARYWSDRKTTIEAVPVGDAPQPGYPCQLRLDVGKRAIKRYRVLADIQKAKEDGLDLSRYLWVPEKHNPLVDFLMFRPNLMGQATISAEHSVLEQKLLETAAFMWKMTGYEELVSYLVVTPYRQACCLKWKTVKRQDRRLHDGLLRFIGTYSAHYELPMGPIQETPTEQSAGPTAGFQLDPDEVKSAVERMLAAAKKKSEGAKKAAMNKKRKLAESGLSDAAIVSEMEVEYSFCVARELGVTSSDEDFEDVQAVVRHCITSYADQWSTDEDEEMNSS